MSVREDHAALGIHRGRECAIILRAAEVSGVSQLTAIRGDSRREGVRQSGVGGLLRECHREIYAARSSGHYHVTGCVESDAGDPILRLEHAGLGGVDHIALHGGVTAR